MLSVLKTFFFHAVLPREIRALGGLFLRHGEKRESSQTSILALIFLLEEKFWATTILTLHRLRTRYHAKKNNDLLQEQLGNKRLSEYDVSLHLVSLFSKTYGGKGFAKERLARCYYCNEPRQDEPCKGCNDIILTGTRCWCTWSIGDEIPPMCEICENEGFVGTLLMP